MTRTGRPHHGRRATMVTIAQLAVAGLVGCSSGPPPPVQSKSYETQILESRQHKDEVFRTDRDNSPILETERASFPGLVYFPIDPAYHVPAALDEDRSGPPVEIILPTSQNQPRRMLRVGKLRFTVGGTSLALSAFAGEGAPLTQLFVPFGDLTNRQETYGGGRYLDLDRTATGLYNLDFNQAYNPFCVYNINYDCPIPPPENRLQVAIRAGERMRAEGAPR